MLRLPIMLALVAATANADYTFTNIADSKPGSGVTFVASSQVVLTTEGEVFFNASSQGSNSRGMIMAGSGGPLRTIVDPLNQFQAVVLVSANAQGVALFYALRNDFTYALYTSSGGAVSPVPVPPNSVIATTGDINDNGVVVFRSLNTIYLASNGVLTPITQGAGTVGQINRLGDVVFFSGNTLKLYSGGQVRDLGQPSADFRLFAPYMGINDSGVVVVNGAKGTLLAPTLFRIDASGITTVGTGTDYVAPNINNRGTISFVANNGSGIYVGSFSNEGKVIAAGDTLFGSKVRGIGGMGGVPGRYLNDRGQIAFTYFLENGVNGVALATPATAATPMLQQGSVVNGAAYLPGLVGGSWAQVKGTDLAPTTRIWQARDFANATTLPTALDGVEVRVSGVSSAVYFISPEQVSFQVPNSVTGNVTVQLIRNGVSSNIVTANVVTTAPGLFAYNAASKLYPAAVFANSTIVVGDPAVSGSIVSKARPGSRVALYATGLAPSPSGIVPSGTNFGGVTATIGGSPTTVEFAGLVAVGQFQINIVVPSLPPGEYPLVLRYNGQESQPGVSFPISAP